MPDATLPPGTYEAASAAQVGAQNPLKAALLAAAPLIRADERACAVAELERLRGIIRSLTAERDELVSQVAVLKGREL